MGLVVHKNKCPFTYSSSHLVYCIHMALNCSSPPVLARLEEKITEP